MGKRFGRWLLVGVMLVPLCARDLQAQGRGKTGMILATTREADDRRERLVGMERRLVEAMSPQETDAVDMPAAALSRELLADARVLWKEGDGVQKALARVAFGRHEDAEAMLEKLGPAGGELGVEEAYRRFTVRGHNWYRARKLDRAAAMYEKAMVLRPGDNQTRNNATYAHWFMADDSKQTHLKRAIAILTGTVEICEEGTEDWAMTQCNLGRAWHALQVGDVDENLAKAAEHYAISLKAYAELEQPWNQAILHYNLGLVWATRTMDERGEYRRKAIVQYERALRLRSRPDDPQSWADTQFYLGCAWYDLYDLDGTNSLRQAIRAYEAALEVETRANPDRWANLHYNLGLAHRYLMEGDRAQLVARAMAEFRESQQVHTKERSPRLWATANYHLGDLLREVEQGNRLLNLIDAIAAYDLATEYYTRREHAAMWGILQHRIGECLLELPMDARARQVNVGRAIETFERALGVRTRESDPKAWAQTQAELGRAWLVSSEFSDGNTQVGMLQKSIAAFQSALTVINRKEDRGKWGEIQYEMGNAWQKSKSKDRNADLRRAIGCYRRALAVWSREREPESWARTQMQMGMAWGDLEATDSAMAIGNAIEALEAAETVLTQATHPKEWADIQVALGFAWWELPEEEEDTHLKAADRFEAALAVYTRQDYPEDWARIQGSVVAVLLFRETEQKAENLARIRRALESVMQYHTRERSPADWAESQMDLGYAWLEYGPDDEPERWRRALEHLDLALEVFDRRDNPLKWGRAHAFRARALRKMGPDRVANLKKAVEAVELSLQVNPRSTEEERWTQRQADLADIYIDLAEADAGGACEWLRKSIAHRKAVLGVWTEQEDAELHGEEREAMEKALTAYGALPCAKERPAETIEAAE